MFVKGEYRIYAHFNLLSNQSHMATFYRSVRDCRGIQTAENMVSHVEMGMNRASPRLTQKSPSWGLNFFLGLDLNLLLPSPPIHSLATLIPLWLIKVHQTPTPLSNESNTFVTLIFRISHLLPMFILDCHKFSHTNLNFK